MLCTTIACSSCVISLTDQDSSGTKGGNSIYKRGVFLKSCRAVFKSEFFRVPEALDQNKILEMS